MVELSYLEYVGAAHSTSTMRVFPGPVERRGHAVALLEFEPMGKLRRCQLISGEEAQLLRALLLDPSFNRALTDEVEAGHDPGLNVDLVDIRWGLSRVQRPVEELTDKSRKALAGIEAVFRRRFPQRTDTYLGFTLLPAKGQGRNAGDLTSNNPLNLPVTSLACARDAPAG